MKLIVAILIALSLIGSPGAARAAPSVSCTMAGAAAGMALTTRRWAAARLSVQLLHQQPSCRQQISMRTR